MELHEKLRELKKLKEKEMEWESKKELRKDDVIVEL